MKDLKILIKLNLVGLLLVSNIAYSQENHTTDHLFAKARTAAFDENDYAKAIALAKQALDKSPDYLELRVFLGRIYTFSDSLEYARISFKEVLKREVGHEDASLAWGNLEFWNNNSRKALDIVNTGLKNHPASEGLTLLKIKLLQDIEKLPEAVTLAEEAMLTFPDNQEIKAVYEVLKTLNIKNSIGIDYRFVAFDKRFDDPWHLVSLDYSRLTSIGSIFGKLNYANRFSNGAFQFEIDAYPSLSKTFYLYLNAGVSDDSGVFPKFRTGVSIFSNLPAAFELDAGFRYLSFDSDTWIYTFGAGKYYKSYWFNLRTYLVPSSDAVSHSYIFTLRYYTGGTDDFFSLTLGTGISPDDETNSVLFNPDATFRLRSSNIGIGYRTTIAKKNVLYFNIGLENQEYAPDTRGNQFSVSAGYIQRF